MLLVVWGVALMVGWLLAVEGVYVVPRTTADIRRARPPSFRRKPESRGAGQQGGARDLTVNPS